jgi:hypothetical protein
MALKLKWMMLLVFPPDKSQSRKRIEKKSKPCTCRWGRKEEGAGEPRNGGTFTTTGREIGTTTIGNRGPSPPLDLGDVDLSD